MQDQFGKIQNLQLRGYESIRGLKDLALDDINIVIGQNGAGKSNFVGIFRFLARLVREELQAFVTKQGGLQKILHFGPQVTEEMSTDVRSDRNRYEAAFAPTEDGLLTFTGERCAYLKISKSIWVPNQFETQLRRTRQAGAIPPHIYEAIEN